MKLLWTLILLYVIYRIVRSIMGGSVVIRNFNYHVHNDNKKEEGEVKIKNPGRDKRPGRINSDSGEYIDYEEVKD